MLFVCDDDKEVGFALFFHNFSTFLGRAGIYLEDLFVLPEYRGKGYGKALLKKWGLPETLVGVASIALGYADCEQPVAKPRKEDYIVKV